MASTRTLPITIQGKPAYVTYDDELFWLNRVPAGASSSSSGSKEATTARTDPLHAYICVPHALILHSSFIPDSDGGSLLLRLLAPPSHVERSVLPPFRALKSRAARVTELRRKLDAEDVRESTRRFAAQVTGPCSNLRLVKIEARVDETAEDAMEWAEGLMRLAYVDSKPYRKMRVLVNPFGGPGKAIALFHSRIRPILDAAGCTVDATITTHTHHGTEIAADLKLSDGWNAIVCVSGDGMLHEVLNGLAKRDDAEQALQVPLVPIPTGSGNAVAVNLLGVTQGFNLALASLNAIKGKPMQVDVCSVTQPTEPGDGMTSPPRNGSVLKASSVQTGADSSVDIEAPGTSVAPSSSGSAAPSGPGYDVGYSFLSQAIGLMADVDLGTEDMRMLGDTRFVLGFIGGVLANKECEVDVYVKFGKRGTLDKSEMRNRAQKAAVEADQGVVHANEDRAAVKDTRTADQHHAEASTTAAALVEAGARNGALSDPARLAKLRNGSVTESLSSHGGVSTREPPIMVPRDPSWPKSLLTGTSDEGATAETLDPQQWYRMQVPIAALYGGKIPYVSRDLMQFPYALPHDRCVDLTLMLHTGGRMGKLRGISSAETGAVVYDPAMVYVKCEAYRVVPRLAAGHKRLRKGGLISIDGESKPYRAFQVEVDDGVQVRFLSLFGRWQVADVAPPPLSAGS